MNLLILNMILMTSMIFIFLNHPLSLGLILLTQTFLVALITGMMTLNYWFSYIIFLIMVGGMLILFIYMTSIASNEKFKFSLKMTFISLIIFCLISCMSLLDPLYFNLILNNQDITNQFNNLNFNFSLNKFIIDPLNKIFYMMIIYLLITLIMTVKITNINYGPIRQKF